MTIYDELQTITADIINEFQQGNVNLIQITPGAGPADNPGASTETSHELNASVKGVSHKYVSNGFAVVSDLEVVCAVLSDVTPTEKDFIEIDNIKYKIVNDISVPQAGTKVAWKFIVRKGG